MKNKIIISIVFFMCIISGILSALGDGEFFDGCKFGCGVAQYFALAVFVISLSLAARERENNLFGVNNIYKLTRLKSRKTALLIEILRLTLWDTATTAVWCTAIYITERLNKNAIDTDKYLLFCIFSFLIINLFMLSQMIAEIIFSSKMFFAVSNIVYFALLAAGDKLFELSQYRGADNIYLRLNRADILNYTSISRLDILFDNFIYPLLTIAAITVLIILFAFSQIKKCDIITRSKI